MRLLGMIGRVWKEVGIHRRKIRCPFGVGVEECLRAVVVRHDDVEKKAVIYRFRSE